MGLYRQPLEPYPVPAPAMAPKDGEPRRKASAFPPAWVKTQEDYDNWLEEEVRWTLEHPGRTYSNEEAWAILDGYLDKLIEARECRDVAQA